MMTLLSTHVKKVNTMARASLLTEPKKTKESDTDKPQTLAEKLKRYTPLVATVDQIYTQIWGRRLLTDSPGF